MIRPFARPAVVIFAAAVAALGGAASTPAVAGASPNSVMTVLLNAPTVSSTGWWWTNSVGTVFQSPPIVVSVSGGVAPYSFTWQRISGDSSVVATNPTSSVTDFNTFVPVGQLFSTSAQFRCLVRDSGGSSAFTPTVTASFVQETGE